LTTAISLMQYEWWAWHVGVSADRAAACSKTALRFIQVYL